MIALKCDPNVGKLDFKILATDIDPVIVQKARSAVFRNDELEGINSRYYRSDDIIHGPQDDPSVFTVSSSVKSLITFGVLNLIRELPFGRPFNVIFCRNVAIYFNRETQQAVWTQFSRLLPSGAKLFIGHSERISSVDQPSLEPFGITAYQKI